MSLILLLFACVQVFTGTRTIAHPNTNGVLSVTVYGWSRFAGYSYTAGSSVEETNNGLRNGGNITIITHDYSLALII